MWGRCVSCLKGGDQIAIINLSGNKILVCESCYDPADPQQQSEKSIEHKGNNKQLIGYGGNSTPSKYNDTIKQTVSNESLPDYDNVNSVIGDPIDLSGVVKNLAISDCPKSISPDVDYYRKMFDKWIRLFARPEDTRVIITDRGSGKSKNTAIYILARIASDPDYEGSFLMRNWDEPARQIKEYYQKILDEFCYTIWQGDITHKKRDKWFLDWMSQYKGIKYRDALRCHFLDLYSPEQVRTLINKPVKDMFFDEAVPTRHQIKEKRGWKVDEEMKYSDAVTSLARNTKIKKTFLANPNDTYFNCWFLRYWDKEIKDLSEWYWRERNKMTTEQWNKWTWVKEISKGGRLLYLEKLEHIESDFITYESNNWDVFFTSPDELGIAELPRASRPLFIFNKTVCYLSVKGYWYFASMYDRNLHSKDSFEYLPEVCVDNKTRLWSRQKRKRQRVKEEFIKDLLWKQEKGCLWYCSGEVKQKMETFIGEGKII